MMLEYFGWNEAANLITNGLSKAIEQKKVTYDLARLMEPKVEPCLLYTSPSPRDKRQSRMPSSA